jgi:hypothetical protein
MIGGSNGIATLLNNERIYREGQVEESQQAAVEKDQSAEQTVSDITRFSAEAIALSREVVAAGDVQEQDASPAAERNAEGNQIAASPPFRVIA